MDVIVTNLQGAQVDAGFVRDVIVQALRLQGYREPRDVSVALVDDSYIRVLNREYRGGDYATDVLAFPIDAGAPENGGRPTSSKGGEALLGDIVISIERARDQARQYRHPVRREVALLAIHGLLHLLGYDDETEGAASVMWARQTELLQSILGERPRPSPSSRSGRSGGSARSRDTLRRRRRTGRGAPRGLRR
jgi:probable rRNA maturation factor